MSMIHSQGAPTNVEWPVAAGNPGGMRYSPLKQINASNVNQLQVAWTYDVSDGAGTLETNPIVVNGVLYGYTPAQKVFAVERSDRAAALAVRFWRSGQGKQPGRRCTGATDRKSGSSRAFGSTCIRSMPRPASRIRSGEIGGRIDFRADLRGGRREPSGALGHPPVIYKDLVIFAGRTGETLPVAPGPVRAYDARTGKLRWTFNTVPHPGEFGYDTWPKDAWTYCGQRCLVAGHEPGRAARHRVRGHGKSRQHVHWPGSARETTSSATTLLRARCEDRQADLALPDGETRYLGPGSPFASLVDHRQARRQER